MDINALQSVNPNYQSQKKAVKNKAEEVTTANKEETVTPKTADTVEPKASEAVVYEHSEETDGQVDLNPYKTDMNKIIAMKEESDQRLIELFKSTVKEGTLKQLGGLRGFIDKFKAGEISKSDLEFEATEEAVAKAQEETGEDGYWGAEKTSDRFLEFAKALSGGDPSKADMLLDAVKEGYKIAEELWGEEFPQLSKDTLALTIKKFEAWRDGTEGDVEASGEDESTVE